MGTNYYLITSACPHCGRGDERLHIGKSSYGWCFALHVIDEAWVEPEDRIAILDDWRKRWSAPGTRIVDEYGGVISTETMERIITERKGKPKDYPNEFYSSEEEFYRQNHAVPGPNNLSRHLIDGRHCVEYGEGTWDYIRGEFS